MATLNYLDGFEHGLAGSGNNGPYDGVTGAPAIVTTTPRTGARCLEVDAAAAAENVSRTVAATVVTQAVYIRFPTSLPSTNVRLVRFANVNGSGYVRFNATTSKFNIFVGVGVDVDVGPVLVADTWYRIVAELDSATGTTTIRCKIDNGTEASANQVQVSVNTTACELGWDNTATATVRYDDWQVSVTDGDYEEMSGTWTAHAVDKISPSADGTHNITTAGDLDDITDAFSNATTNSYLNINDVPLNTTNTADNIIRQDLGTTAEYMEHTFEDLAFGGDTPLDVFGLAYHADSANAGASLGEVRILLSDDTEVLFTGSTSLVNSTEDPNQIVTLRDKLAIRPTGGWDATKINGLKDRVGFADNAPDFHVLGIMLQVARYTVPAAAQSLVVPPVHPVLQALRSR